MGISRFYAAKTIGCVLLLTSLLYPQNEKPTLAVMEFEGRGISLHEAELLTDRFRTEAVSIGKYRIMDRGSMDQILREQKFQQSGCSSEECLVEMGKFLGVRYMLGAKVGLVGETYTISMRVIDVETAEIVRTTSYDMAGKIDRLLTEGVREAALKIFPEFEHPLAQVFVRSNPPGATITLDGEEMGTTPVILKRLESVLPHSISLALPSHLPFDTLFTLEEGLNPPLDIDLIHEQGYLTVDSRFVGWDVYINRHKIGSTPISSHSYPTGEYILKVKSPGFYPAEEPFTLTPDLDYKYFAELEPKSKRKAVLLSIVLPGAGQVYQGYSLKGIGLMSGTLLTGWLAVQGSQDFDQSRSDYEMKIDDYNAEQDPVEWESKKAIADQAFNTMKDDELSYQLRLALLGLLWTVNLIEVSF